MTREEQTIEEAKNRFLDDQIYPASKMYAFVEGAEWEHKRLVEKACEYLQKALGSNGNTQDLSDLMIMDFIVNFSKAMEE